MTHFAGVARTRCPASDVDVLERATALTNRVKVIRDDYVIHRSAKKPRAARGLASYGEGRWRLSVGGLRGPRPDQTPELVILTDPSELMVELEAYVEAVVEFFEQLTPADQVASESTAC